MPNDRNLMPWEEPYRAPPQRKIGPMIPGAGYAVAYGYIHEETGEPEVYWEPVVAWAVFRYVEHPGDDEVKALTQMDGESAILDDPARGFLGVFPPEARTAELKDDLAQRVRKNHESEQRTRALESETVELVKAWPDPAAVAADLRPYCHNHQKARVILLLAQGDREQVRALRHKSYTDLWTRARAAGMSI